MATPPNFTDLQRSQRLAATSRLTFNAVVNAGAPAAQSNPAQQLPANIPQPRVDVTATGSGTRTIVSFVTTCYNSASGTNTLPAYAPAPYSVYGVGVNATHPNFNTWIICSALNGTQYTYSNVTVNSNNNALFTAYARDSQGNGTDFRYSSAPLSYPGWTPTPTPTPTPTVTPTPTITPTGAPTFTPTPTLTLTPTPVPRTDNICVSGSLISEVFGIYTYSSGGNYWTKTLGGVVTVRVVYNSSAALWLMAQFINGNQATVYYVNTTSPGSVNPPQTGWQQSAGGPPFPIISYGVCATPTPTPTPTVTPTPTITPTGAPTFTPTPTISPTPTVTPTPTPTATPTPTPTPTPLVGSIFNLIS